jgi:hypothetical protein
MKEDCIMEIRKPKKWTSPGPKKPFKEKTSKERPVHLNWADICSICKDLGHKAEKCPKNK